MKYYVGTMPVGDNELRHYGIKGMRWGQRRYQNRDGSLTAAGRLKYGYGQARRGAQRAYGNASGWYQRNKKTVRRAAAVAGGLAVAGLGYKYRKPLAKAARAFGGKAGRTARSIGGKAKNFANTMNVKREAGVARRNLNRKAAQLYKNTGIKNPDYLRKSDKFFIDTGKKAKGSVQKLKQVPHNVSVKTSAGVQKRKLGRAQTKIYKQTGIVGDQMTKGQKRMADASMKTSAALKKAKQAPKNAVNSVKRKRDIRNTKRAGEEMDFLRRRKAARDSGKDLVKGSARDAFRLRGRRVTTAVGGAASKVGGTAKNVVRKTGSAAKKAGGTAKKVVRKVNTPAGRHIMGTTGAAMIGGAYYYDRKGRRRKRSR